MKQENTGKGQGGTSREKRGVMEGGGERYRKREADQDLDFNSNRSIHEK